MICLAAQVFPVTWIDKIFLHKVDHRIRVGSYIFIQVSDNTFSIWMSFFDKNFHPIFDLHRAISRFMIRSFNENFVKVFCHIPTEV